MRARRGARRRPAARRSSATVGAVVPEPRRARPPPGVRRGAPGAACPVLSEFDLATPLGRPPARRHHRHRRQDHGHRAGAGDVRGRRPARGGGGQHRGARSSRPSTTPPSTCSWWRRRRSGCSTRIASRPTSAPGSTSRPTTSTPTASAATPPSTTTSPPRRGSGRTRRADQVAIGNADDPVVAARARAAPAPGRSPSGSSPDADNHLDGDRLVLDTGDTLAEVGELHRAFPHDLANALAAAATVVHGGGTVDGRPRGAAGLPGAPPSGDAWWARLVGWAGTTTRRPPRPTPPAPRCAASTPSC